MQKNLKKRKEGISKSMKHVNNILEDRKEVDK